MDYTKITDYAAKDALLTGDPAKLVKGTEIGADLDAVAVAVATKHDAADIGVAVQAYDAFLTSIATLGTAADKMLYTTAANTAAESAITAAGRAILDDATASDQLTTLGGTTAGKAVFTAATVAAAQQAIDVEVGVDVQAYDATLASLAGLTLTEGALLTATGADAAAVLAKGTAGQQLRMNAGATAPEWFTPASSSGITLGTPVASTSGTSIDFTSIPAGTKRVTVMFDGVSTNGTSPVQVQIGDSGGIEATNYLGATSRSGTTSAANNSAGFLFEDSGAASVVRHGSLTLSLLSSSANTWAANGNVGRSDSANIWSQGGSKSLSATLDRVRITTVGGTETFDAGTINISYE